MTGDSETEDLPVYAVRLSVQAQQDVTNAAFRLAELTQNPVLAEQWAEGLYIEVGKLATNPRGYVVAEHETRRFRRETRQMVYRRSASSVAYRILFAVSKEGADGPTVTILHVRHGGRKPLTREEARQILANQ